MTLTAAQAEARRTRVGASEVAALMGEHPFMGPWDIYDRLVLGQAREVSQRMAVGQYLEPHVLGLYRALYGVRARACTKPYVHPYLPLTASPDAYVLDGQGLVEVKVTSAWAASMPRYVYWQAMAQMGLARRAYCNVVVLNGSALNETRVDFDTPAWDALQGAVLDFWQHYLIPEVRPVRPELVFTAPAKGTDR